MKEKLRLLPMKALSALCLLAGMAPLSILMGRQWLPDRPALWLLPLLAAGVFGVIGYFIGKKGRVLFSLLGCLGLLLWGVWALLPIGWPAMLTLLPGIAALLLLPTAWPRPFWQEWSPGMWIGGVILHLAAQVFATRPGFSGTQETLRAIFALYAFLLLLYLNRNGLRDGMHGTGKAPEAIRNRNLALIVAFFIVGLVLSSVRALAQGLDTTWRFLKEIVYRVVAFLLNLFPAGEEMVGGTGGGMDGMMGMPHMEEAEPSAFALFMEKALYVVGMALAAVAAAFAVRFLIKMLIRLFRKLKERLRAYASAVSEDYVDEAESTLNWEEKTKSIRDTLKKAVKRPLRQPDWNTLDGRERVRRLYQMYLKKTPDAKKKTAREALGADARLSREQAGRFVQLYEQARYSDHPIQPSDADRLRQEIK